MYIIEDNRVLPLLIIIGLFFIAFMFIRTIFRIIKRMLGSIWCLLTGKKRKKYDPLRSEDWLTRAQERQEIRFQNALPSLQEEAKPIKRTRKERRNQKKGLSPTGWEYNEEKGTWEAPEYIRYEANTRWEWNEEKRIWIDKSKKKRR